MSEEESEKNKGHAKVIHKILSYLEKESIENLVAPTLRANTLSTSYNKSSFYMCSVQCRN